jgi:hypothetical protein
MTDHVTEVPATAPAVKLGLLESLFSSIFPKNKISILDPLKGTSSLSVLFGFLLTIFILNKFLSPLITVLAMNAVIAPITALALLLVGEFDSSNLQKMLTENVGTVAVTVSVVLFVLFIQNLVKVTMLVQSFRESHKQYRTHSIAGLLAPITTTTIWYIFIWLGYYPGVKTIVIGMLLGSAGGALAQINDLAGLGEVVKSARWMAVFLLCVHVFFLGLTYYHVHRGLNFLLEKSFNFEFFKKFFNPEAVPLPIVMVCLIGVGFLLERYTLLTWNMVIAIVICAALFFSEIYRFWIGDDTEGGEFEFLFGAKTKVTTFNQAEASQRRATRCWMLVGFGIGVSTALLSISLPREAGFWGVILGLAGAFLLPNFIDLRDNEMYKKAK